FLQSGHWAYLHCALHEFDRMVGESSVAYLAVVYEPVYLPPRVFHRRFGVNVVYLIEVDMVCLKPGKRLLDLSPNCLRPQVHVTLTVLAADRATLGEDHGILPSSFEGLANDRLCSPPSIEWSGIYPVDSGVKSCSDSLDSCLLIVLTPVDVLVAGCAY